MGAGKYFKKQNVTNAEPTMMGSIASHTKAIRFAQLITNSMFTFIVFHHYDEKRNKKTDMKTDYQIILKSICEKSGY